MLQDQLYVKSALFIVWLFSALKLRPVSPEDIHSFLLNHRVWRSARLFGRQDIPRCRPHLVVPIIHMYSLRSPCLPKRLHVSYKPECQVPRGISRKRKERNAPPQRGWIRGCRLSPTTEIFRLRLLMSSGNDEKTVGKPTRLTPANTRSLSLAFGEMLNVVHVS